MWACCTWVNSKDEGAVGPVGMANWGRSYRWGSGLGKRPVGRAIWISPCQLRFADGERSSGMVCCGRLNQ